MKIEVPPELADTVERLRATGQFERDEEVLRVALVDLDRRTKTQAEKHAALKAAIAEGLEGPFEAWDMDDVRREVAERLALMPSGC